jgi:hypothetical protein
MRKTCSKERKKRQTKPYQRKVHIGGQEWTYRVTRHCLQIANPDCSKKWKVDLTDFTGMTWEQLERAEWKKYFPRIGPKDVKKYIEEKLVGMTV